MNLLNQPASLAPAVPALRCTIVTDLANLARHAPDWEDLLVRSSANEPMLSPAWLLTWWDLYGAGRGRRLCVGLFHEHDRLVGLAPLQRRCCWHRSVLPMRRLEPLGADVNEGDGVCSEYLNILAEHGTEEPVAAALVDAMCAGSFGTWDELVLPAMDGAGPMPAVLDGACRHAGIRAEIQATDVAPYIPLPATWDDYLKQLGKDRRFVLKTLRDFEEWAAGTAAFHHAATPAELEQGRAILQALHAERWQGAGEQGVFRAARFALFHERVMGLFLKRGALQLAWLTAHGRPLAAVYNFYWNNKVYFYQSGRVLDVPKNIRPGIVLHVHCIQSAIARGCREYDFLGGASQYKQQLSLNSRTVVRFRACRFGLRERARLLTEQGIDLLQQVRNQIRKR
jgi:CelD/BcsL family acetyltransferase involved in cellulose biosynthesis